MLLDTPLDPLNFFRATFLLKGLPTSLTVGNLKREKGLSPVSDYWKNWPLVKVLDFVEYVCNVEISNLEPKTIKCFIYKCFHKHNIYNLIYMIIHMKKTLFWFLVGDYYISDMFYRIQNLNLWPVFPVITHWTYTCLSPWAL